MPCAVLALQAEPVPPAIEAVFRRHGMDDTQAIPTEEATLVLLRQRRVAVLLLPIPERPELLARWAHELRRHPDVLSIGVAPQADAELVLAAMRAGIREFLVTPIVPAALDAALDRSLTVAGQTRGTGAGTVYAVHAAKGGVGVSTIATSLAWALAHAGGRAVGSRATEERERCALVDFTTTGIGVRGMLHMEPPHDLASLSERPERLDRALLRSVIFEHPEQLGILASPRDPSDVEALDPVNVGRVLELLRADFRHVVVDTDHHLGGQTLGILDIADTILLVTQRDLVSLRSTQRALTLFQRLGYPESRVQLLINRASARDRLGTDDVVRALGRPVLGELPNDYAACEYATTAGVFIPQSRRTVFAQAITQLAVRLARPARDPGDAPGTSPRTSGLSAGAMGRFGVLFRRR